MIEQISFKFGKAPLRPLTLSTAPVTVFVGPNNSGKSLVLAEIDRYCSNGNKSTTDSIVEEITFRPSSPAKVEEYLSRMVIQPRVGESVLPGNILIGSARGRYHLTRDSFQQFLVAPSTQPQQFAVFFLAHKTLKLDGPGRIGLVKDKPAGDWLGEPQNSLQVLARDFEKRSDVRRIVHDALGSYFVIDPTLGGVLRIRLAPRPPESEIEEFGLHSQARDFHSQATLIDSVSDGVKAFTGIVTEILAGDPLVILIDEPEAFLHPSLSFKLGNEIAGLASRADKRVFVSTHSPSFVMGCIQSGAQLNVVRLTYRERQATARVLPNDEILRLMRNPLLRSTGVLGGLFYEFVIVTESDTDRAFYQEINERLLRFSPEFGIPNCLFLNAQNKQTVRTVIRPLRDLGIPAAAIVDIDIVKEGGTVWANFLESGFVPEIQRQSLATSRSLVLQKFEECGRNMKRDGGIGLLVGGDQEAANNLFDQLAEYGLFALRNGEIESWLRDLGVDGHGPGWLIPLFEKMGDNPDSAEFVKPSTGDVWAFIAGIKKWMTNPFRKGIP